MTELNEKPSGKSCDLVGIKAKVKELKGVEERLTYLHEVSKISDMPILEFIEVLYHLYENAEHELLDANRRIAGLEGVEEQCKEFKKVPSRLDKRHVALLGLWIFVSYLSIYFNNF